jgi:ATP phosphoribosyltransferase
MTSPLLLAVPSKGRLEENARAFFARAGLALTRGRGVRDYRGTIRGVGGTEVAYLSAAEIARDLAAGAVHLGVTGEDLIHETIGDADKRVEVVTRLGFGEATVVVAVPQSWIDVTTMDDLDDVAHAFRARHGRRLRVATKYINLTRRFFAQAGVADYRIVESLGATEGAPAAGTAEIIVDITTTGATLQANALKVLDDGAILKSEACLVASLAADWQPQNREALEDLLSLVAAEAQARQMRKISANLPAGTSLDDIISSGGSASVTPIAIGEGRLVVLAPQDAIGRVVQSLKSAGASHVLVERPDYVFEARNPLFERLSARLDGTS